jgi:hypothetical protein
MVGRLLLLAVSVLAELSHSRHEIKTFHAALNRDIR